MGQLERIADKITQEVNKDMDAVIAVSGNVGIGKSTCALQLARCLYKNFKKKFSLDCLCYSTNDLIDRLQNNKYDIIVVDEGALVAHSHDWAKKINKVLDKVLDISRFNHNMVIFCKKDYFELQKAVRNRVRYWLDVYVDENVSYVDDNKVKLELIRGYVVLFERSHNQKLEFSKKRYYSIFEQNDGRDLKKLVNYFKKYYRPFYHNSFKITKLPRAIEKVYDKIAEEKKKYEEGAEEENKFDKKFTRRNVCFGALIGVLINEYGWDHVEIAKWLEKILGEEIALDANNISIIYCEMLDAVPNCGYKRVKERNVYKKKKEKNVLIV